MPVLYNRSVLVDGQPCMDGGLAIPFPLMPALANGCTDLLVLLTRPHHYRSHAPHWLNRRIFDLICARGDDRLNRLYADHHRAANTARDLAFGPLPPPSGINIATICTEYPERINRTTSDARILYLAAADCAHKTARIFGSDAKTWSLPLPSNSL